MVDPYNLDEVYPNSPLAEVVCEIRFPPDLAIDNHIHEFQQQLKAEYPRLTVSKGAAPPQTWTHYRFEGAEGTVGVIVAADKLARYEKSYTGHKNFIRMFFEVFGVFKKIFPVRQLDRVGWRYINVIPYIRQDGLVPLENFLNIKVLYGDAPAKHLKLDVTLESKLGDGSLTTKLSTLQEQGSDREALLLDFDYALTQGLRLDRLRSYVQKAHSTTRHTFESMITDAYRDFLRGEHQ